MDAKCDAYISKVEEGFLLQNVEQIHTLGTVSHMLYFDINKHSKNRQEYAGTQLLLKFLSCSLSLLKACSICCLAVCMVQRSCLETVIWHLFTVTVFSLVGHSSLELPFTHL